VPRRIFEVKGGEVIEVEVKKIARVVAEFVHFKNIIIMTFK
jgi:hypothetical protein